MAKFTSYIKALLPIDEIDSKARFPAHMRNYIPLSPKDMNDISGVVIPRVGANNWNGKDTDLIYLQRMYDCHDLVYSCIDLVSSTFALAKLKVKRIDTHTGKYTYLPHHPLQVLLDNPNNSMTGYDLRQSYIVHRLLYGTTASILLRGDMTISTQESNKCPICHKMEAGGCPHVLWHFNTGPITQIMPVHLDRLGETTINTNNGPKTYFLYDWGDGIKRLVHPNNIMTDPNYNPGGSFYGSSPTDRVKRWLEVDLGMSRQIGAYLVNNAIPSMILNLKPPKYAAGDSPRVEDPSLLLEKMSEMWMNKFSMNRNINGGDKVKAPAFTYGDLEILKIQDGIADIVQKPLFFEIQNRIAMIYKIPRSFFEFGISNRVVAADQNIDFFNYAISPQLKSFKAKITRYILSSYDDPHLDLEWDLSSMGISSFLLDKKESKALKRWELGGITLDELRASLGLNPFHDQDEGLQRYRTSVMSDGSGNTQVNQNHTDNRLQNDPEVDRQANGLLED